MRTAERFAALAAEKILGIIKDAGGDPAAIAEALRKAGPVAVDGQEPLRGYYQPRDRKGNHINILKVKPKLDREKCDGCGICVQVCPMGSIKEEDPGIVSGICIKCCGCVKKCPKGALYFDDPGYLYHKEELEASIPREKNLRFSWDDSVNILPPLIRGGDERNDVKNGGKQRKILYNHTDILSEFEPAYRSYLLHGHG